MTENDQRKELPVHINESGEEKIRRVKERFERRMRGCRTPGEEPCSTKSGLSHTPRPAIFTSRTQGHANPAPPRLEFWEVLVEFARVVHRGILFCQNSTTTMHPRILTSNDREESTQVIYIPPLNGDWSDASPLNVDWSDASPL
ncbi:hypothetical protein HZ326_30019, partial [Fusarium oxysporum f. sp. albedinis]